MNYLLNVCRIATAAHRTCGRAAPSAVAQENTFTITCQDVGGGAPSRSEIARVIRSWLVEYSCRGEFTAR